jgi:hypothetical protein
VLILFAVLMFSVMGAIIKYMGADFTLSLVGKLDKE